MCSTRSSSRTAFAGLTSATKWYLRLTKEMDNAARDLLDGMRQAASADLEFNKQKLPALAKLKLLPAVRISLKKYSNLTKCRFSRCVFR